MSELHRILVPVDIDDPSRQALQYAVDLAERVHAKVDVLHVWSPPKLLRPDLMVYLESNGRAVSLADISQEQARTQLNRLVEEVAGGRENIRALVTFGSAASEIVALSEASAYDLIVMGTRGRTGVPRLLLGSVAQAVVRLAPCPVLVVPPTGKALAETSSR